MAETSSRVRLVFEGSERGVVAAASKSAAAIRGLGDENTKVGKKFAAVDQQATKFIGTLTKTAAVTSLVAAGGGLIGQAFAGALPIMTSLGIAAGTVKLGMDGVKKAAEQLQAPFKQLKADVSDAFAQELTPVFAKLIPVIKGVSGGLQEMAIDLSGVADKLVSVVSSAAGIEKLNAVIKGSRAFIRGMGDGLATFLDGFLSALASAQDQMRGLGTAFGSIFGSIGAAMKDLASDGSIVKVVAGMSATFTGLGKVLGSLVQVVTRLGGAFGDSFGVLFTNLSIGIDKASPGLVDLGLALGDLFRAIAPLLPVIGELAGSFAHSLADGIRAVIPYVQQFADWAKNNIGTIKAIGEGILALALAVKGLSIFTSVLGWVDGVVGAFGRLKGGADGAATSASGLGRSLGLLKGVAIAAGLLAVAEAMDQINIKSAGGVEHLQGFEENLHDIAGAASELLSGDFGRIGDEFAAQMDETVRNIQTGKSAFGEFLGYIKRNLAEKLPDMNFNLNTGPAAGQLDAFIAGVNKNAPTVNINGNANGAGFALREILREIAAGHEFVDIDGKPMKAQDALAFVIGLINNSNPEVNINGTYVKAGDALAQFLGIANKAEATATLKANPLPADETVGGWTRRTEGTTGMAQMNANPVPANAVRDQWVGGVSRTRGTATLDANPAPGNQQVAGWKGRADSTTGTAHLSANPAVANSTTTGWKGTADRTVGTASLHADPGPANETLGGLLTRWSNRVLNWTVHILGGLATGGPVFSGAVHGPGTGTSDTAGLFRLSNGEHVLTARDVQAMGGQAGVLAFRRSLNSGRVPRMSATGGRAATGGGVTAAGALSIPAPQVNVQVHVDGNEVRSIVRTEISQANRSTRRAVLAGTGTSF
jgi:hypothetical protein